MSPRSRCSERGVALVTAIFTITVLVGVSALYLSLSWDGRESERRAEAAVRARLGADEAIALAVAELKSGVDSGGDGLGTVTFSGDDDRELSAAATALGGNLFRIHGEGVVPRARSAADVLAEVIPSDPLTATLRAAITAEGPVSTLGNITVDGRDWSANGTTLVGPGTFGISSRGAISNGGSSTVGGYGRAPAPPAPLAANEPLATWCDLADNDGDFTIDEEAFDGIDNDGDGRIDEDTNDYPDTPDIMFKLPNGTLKDIAIARGTYFSTQTAYESYRAANGGILPGGQIYFLDFSLWQPANLGADMNAPSSIVVHHNSTANALMKNVHGNFRGIILADFVQHINGDFFVAGGFMSFGDKSIGNAYGNGNAIVRYSSSALSGLPSSSATRSVRILSWQRAAME